MARLRADNRKRERTAFQMWVHIQLCKHNETQSCLAAVMGISQQAVSAKLNGKSEITLGDMAVICEHFGEQYQIGGVK